MKITSIRELISYTAKDAQHGWLNDLWNSKRMGPIQIARLTEDAKELGLDITGLKGYTDLVEADYRNELV